MIDNYRRQPRYDIRLGNQIAPSLSSGIFLMVLFIFSYRQLSTFLRGEIQLFHRDAEYYSLQLVLRDHESYAIELSSPWIFGRI
jgi:hypothetical protein